MRQGRTEVTKPDTGGGARPERGGARPGRQRQQRGEDVKRCDKAEKRAVCGRGDYHGPGTETGDTKGEYPVRDFI